MTLQEMIYRRKSVRSYTGEPVGEAQLQKIRAFIADAQPLYPQIRLRYEIADREHVRCIMPWLPPQIIVIFTEDTPKAFENAGFIFQQLDLYLQSMGLGACWLGLGRLSAQGIRQIGRNDGLKPIMMLAFGHPRGEAMRKGAEDFKRRSLADISDRADQRLEPARLAPSSVNSQPWYFTHDGDIIHVYCAQKGLLRTAALRDMNRIDVGIALAQLYIAQPEGFRFFEADAPAVRGHGYIGSFTL